MNLEVRCFNGDSWPEKRVSISDADTGYCLFVSARYAEIEDSRRYAESIAKGYNNVDALADALEALIGAVERGELLDSDFNGAKSALAAYQGE